MRKGEGRAQQLRGHKRRAKVINRRLNRNASDLKAFGGVYDKWYLENLNAQVNKEAEDEGKV